MIKDRYSLIAKKLIEGGVVLLPTDTLYGIASVASNKEAVIRLYKIKNRNNKPGTIISASVADLVKLGLDRLELASAKKYWPGSISLIIKAGKDLEYLHLGKRSLAVRIPDNKNLKKLLAKTGPLLTSSANLPGCNPARTIQEAKAYFGQKVDYYLDDGIMDGQPSTVAKVVNGRLQIIRAGSYFEVE